MVGGEGGQRCVIQAVGEAGAGLGAEGARRSMKLIADLLKRWVARAFKSKTRVFTRAWGGLVQRTSSSMLALVFCAITPQKTAA
ncbi:hypothetical protein B0X78_18350 [bacterium AM6]|nr:hypothetical protein B0X78_18350 [bacterium AM6]